MTKTPVPFDNVKLDSLLEQEGIDVVLASSRHNTRYLTGGYYNWFHSRIARAATQRYLSFVGLRRGCLEDAFFVAGLTERGAVSTDELWIPEQRLTEPAKSPFFQSTEHATEGAIDCVKRRGLGGRRIGVELGFLPASAYEELRRQLPDAELVDATPILAELRAVKTSEEFDILRRNAAKSVDSIQSALATCKTGVTTTEIQQRLQSEMALRGIEMQWLIICMGPDGVSRKWPSDRAWEPGEVLRVDPGTSLNDYIADLSRMACLGEPPHRANEIIAECVSINDRLQATIRPGLTCGELSELGQKLLQEASHHEYGWQITHGGGMVPHEPPVVSGDPNYVLEAGMVMSMETEFQHPEVGDVKVEDFIAVTETGCENFTPNGRGWTIA